MTYSFLNKLLTSRFVRDMKHKEIVTKLLVYNLATSSSNSINHNMHKTTWRQKLTVQKLQLLHEEHVHSYHLAWLQKNNEVSVTRRALVTFSFGDAYHDQLYMWYQWMLFICCWDTHVSWIAKLVTTDTSTLICSNLTNVVSL